MATARITCPGCRANFTLKTPSVESLATKPFRCPKCGRTAPFSQLLGLRPMSQPVPLHTHIAGAGQPTPPPMPNAKTRVAQGAQSLVTLMVMESGKVLPLKTGTYTLGRDSIDSKASVRVAPDRYMSRLHAKIDVTPGGTTITGIAENNPILVNGKSIQAGIPVALRNGDKVQLGMTTLTVTS